MAFNTRTVAPWTILSSRAPITSGLCRPSAFGIYVRRDGWQRPLVIGSPMNTAVQIPEPRLQACFVVIPGHAVHTGGGLALERVECHPQRIDIDVVQERGEPFFL